MWDELTETVGKTICEILPQNPIIIGTRLKVVSHNGISLSSKQQSSFIINLTNIPQINELRQWSINNEEYLAAIINEKRLFPSQTVLRTPQYNNIITINGIQNLPQEQTTFWINASISIKNLRQPFWYMTCIKCRQKADLDNQTSCFNCYNCNESSVETIPRCRFQAQLTDHTGSLIATFFGENAEKMLNCTAQELIHIPSDQNISSVARLSTVSKFFIYLKARADAYSGGSQTKYNVISLLESDSESSTSNTTNDT
ncbi:replication protein A 70 kDa DNA-binding subunit B-like [Cannabis sativa]|uniref:replication protein A 70 kDa DNA-binding subunit B-like n=2 Tax=Cannabis sativa TaxID=3483 RepID=UPI0029CA88CC|nr:replication protein A 70 kDa DNA-binding subunit B-like [Cannabis sativa]